MNNDSVTDNSQRPFSVLNVTFIILSDYGSKDCSLLPKAIQNVEWPVDDDGGTAIE